MMMTAAAAPCDGYHHDIQAEGARPGFCSVFLSCPPNVTLRCWLWAGRLRKEVGYFG